MKEETKETIRATILLILIIGIFLLGFTALVMKKRKAYRENKAHCETLSGRKDFYKLVSLFDYQGIEKHNSLSGGYFLFMGTLSSATNETLEYYIRYAYEDSYGIKLMTENVGNNSGIRIKEIKGTEPRLTIIYTTHYNIHSTISCSENEIYRIFEIPEGTLYKTFEMDMK